MIQVRTTAASHYDGKCTSLTNCSSLWKELICSTLVYNNPRELYDRNSVYVDHTCIWFPWCSIQVDLLNSIQPIHVDSVINFKNVSGVTVIWCYRTLKQDKNLQTGTSECGHELFFFNYSRYGLSVPTTQLTTCNSIHRSQSHPKFWGEKPKATTKVTLRATNNTFACGKYIVCLCVSLTTSTSYVNWDVDESYCFLDT